MTEVKATPETAGTNATVTRAHHPLEGQTLRVLGRMRRHGRLELLLELSDGSKRLIPAEWTDQYRDPVENAVEVTVAAETLGSVEDLLAASGLVSALSTRARDGREQAARQSPCKEDSRAACAAQSAAGPGSGATPDPVGPVPRRRRGHGDHAAGPPDRQGIHPRHEGDGHDGEAGEQE
jgi:hypothetical protein